MLPARFAPLLLPFLLSTLPAQDAPRQIAFGSCHREAKPAPVLATLANLKPDVFIWMGDNVYGDTADMKALAAKYAKLKALPDYRRMMASSRIVGTWDDHDYGRNDAGSEFPARAASQQVFLDFIGEPSESPRRRREGVYTHHDFGKSPFSVRIILLDTRYHRDPKGSDGTILGPAQWVWLEETLKESKAAVNLLVSSIQILPTEHRFEKWADFPKERKRLLRLLAHPDIPPVMLLSGDRHLAEISIDTTSCGYPLHEITSSSLNHPRGGSDDEPNRLRTGKPFREANFGTLSIDVSRKAPVLTACIRDKEGIPQRAVTLELGKKIGNIK
jgi:alkaline phosphatase D